MLNYVIVGIIAAFAAIMLVNALVAATIHRRDELGLLRLAGSTPAQARRMVALESVVLLVTRSSPRRRWAAFTAVPYAIARTDSLFPESGSAVAINVVGVAAVLTLAAALAAARRALRSPAIEASNARWRDDTSQVIATRIRHVHLQGLRRRERRDSNPRPPA